MLYIGVDLGTSAVKLLLMDESGKVLNIVSKEYPISFPKPGWSEQNPCDWWEQTVAGLIELTKDFDRSAGWNRQEPGGGHQLRRSDAWTCRIG